MQASSRPTHRAEIHFHLRWVAKIALSVGAMAAAGLALMLTLLTDGRGTAYGELIQSHSAIQENLTPALLVGGLVLVSCTGVLTWFVALYSSFRIAGPLFRFTRNLETAIELGPVRPVPIRNHDKLHADARLLEQALLAMETHYREIRDEIDRALVELDRGQFDASQRQATALKLARLIKRASL